METTKNLNPDPARDGHLRELRERINKDASFIFVREIIKQWGSAEIYLVGGAIRDALLGKEVKDFDFLVTGIEKGELEKFLNKFGKVEDVESRAFGVFKFRPYGWQGEEIDVSLPRKEKLIGFGYKDFKIETSAKLTVEDDLARRDFTINAIALRIKNHKLIDLFGGIDDLKKKTIRAVGKPEVRFQEDPSRILRAVRFACQLDFAIEKETLKAAKKMSSEIIKEFVDERGQRKIRVSFETISAEFLKGFDAAPLRLIELYEELGLLKFLFPELEAMKKVAQPEEFHAEGDVWQHTLLALKKLKPETDINVKIALLFHDVGKPLTQTLPRKKEDRIRFNEHDIRGAEIFAKIYERLHLAAPFGKNHPLHVSKKEVVWLIRHHMICVGHNPENMRRGTIEKYFFQNQKWGKDLLELSYFDIAATLPPSGKPDFTSLNLLKKRIKEVARVLEASQKEAQLIKKFPYIIDGHGVQQVFRIPPGPLVGRIKELIRYLQLEGKLKNLKDVEEQKEKILEACQHTSTTEEAQEWFNKLQKKK